MRLMARKPLPGKDSGYSSSVAFRIYHVHLLVELNPKAAPSVVANNLKTVSSRLLRKEFSAQLQQVYRKPVLWSRSYFVCSCGGASLEVIKAYIQSQERPISA